MEWSKRPTFFTYDHKAWVVFDVKLVFDGRDRLKCLLKFDIIQYFYPNNITWKKIIFTHWFFILASYIFI